MKWLWKVVKTVTLVVPIVKGIIGIWKSDEPTPPPPPHTPVQK